MFILQRPLISYGLVLWIGGTLLLRLFGHRLLHPDQPTGTLLLFAVTFPLIAWLVRRLCRANQLPREQWPAGAISVLLPTLLLDPFSSAFFPVMFPNMPGAAAGIFGGWMLWCCAGALLGVTMRR